MSDQDQPTETGSFFRRHWRAIAAVVFVIAALWLIRPFETVEDPTGDDIAVAWNESIGRLGITPVYPPTEDLSVGDVWAIVTEVDRGKNKQILNSTPLLGKAVRIGHIDLRARVLAASKQPTFSDTADPVDDQKVWKQDRWEVKPADDSTKGRIPLSLTAFPGVTIDHKSRTGAQVGSGGGWFGGQRQTQQQEQIRIKAAETYGISTPAGIFELNQWCAAEPQSCSDETVRKMLSYGVGEKLLETVGTPKKYSSLLSLQLVTRVFLMRQIEHRITNDVARGAAVQAGDAKADSGDGTAAQGSSIDAVARGLGPGATEGGRMSMASSDALGISLTETFQRPVAFGYRAVTISLKPSVPEEKKP